MKTLISLSIVSSLLLSAVPAFAKEDVNVVGGHNSQQNVNITNKTNITNNIVNVQFNDIKGHWAEKYIQDLVKRGILSGKDEHSFDPDGLVSRAEFATMVAKYFHLKNKTKDQDFEDVPMKFWGFPFIEATKDYFNAYVSLDGGLLFKPEEGGKREDVTVTLVKILTKIDPNIKLLNDEATEKVLKTHFIDDEDQIAYALRPYVATAFYYGLINGDDEGSFSPKRVLTRAESATLLDRLQDNTMVIVGDLTNTESTVTSDVYKK